MTGISSDSKIVLKSDIILTLTLADNGVSCATALTMCLHDANACTEQQ